MEMQACPCLTWGLKGRPKPSPFCQAIQDRFWTKVPRT